MFKILKSNLPLSVPSRISAPVLATQRKPYDACDDQIRNQIATRKAMPKVVMWARLWPIQLCAQHRAQVPNCDLQRARNSALRLTRHVGHWPRQGERYRRVDASGRENRATVADAGLVVRQEDDVAQHSERGRRQNERRPPSGPLRQICP